MNKLTVRSTSIDWIDQTLEITDTTNTKHTIPLDTTIHAKMIGFPDPVEETMLAHDLGEYMSRGYIIQEISYEENKS